MKQSKLQKKMEKDLNNELTKQDIKIDERRIKTRTYAV